MIISKHMSVVVCFISLHERDQYVEVGNYNTKLVTL